MTGMSLSKTITNPSGQSTISLYMQPTSLTENASSNAEIQQHHPVPTWLRNDIRRLTAQIPLRRENQPIQLHTFTHQLHSPVQHLPKHHMRIQRKRLHLPHHIPTHPQWLACKVSSSTPDNLTVLGTWDELSINNDLILKDS